MSIITSAIVSSAPFCRQISASPHLIEREALNDIFEHEPIVATYAFELYIYWRFIVSCLYIKLSVTRFAICAHIAHSPHKHTYAAIGNGTDGVHLWDETGVMSMTK